MNAQKVFDNYKWCNNCGLLSQNGFWCRACLEHNWPYAAAPDGVHCYINKLGIEIAPGLYLGALGAPYEVGQVTAVWGQASWLLSPLGAVSELVVGANAAIWRRSILTGRLFIITALARFADLTLEPNLILATTAPVLVVRAIPVRALARLGLTAKKAKVWLSDVNHFAPAVNQWENWLKPRQRFPVAIPPTSSLYHRDSDHLYRITDKALKKGLGTCYRLFNGLRQRLMAEANVFSIEEIKAIRTQRAVTVEYVCQQSRQAVVVALR